MMYTNLRPRLRLAWKFRPIVESLEERRVLSGLGTHPHLHPQPSPEPSDTPANKAPDESGTAKAHEQGDGKDRDTGDRQSGHHAKEDSEEKQAARRESAGQQKSGNAASTDEIRDSQKATAAAGSASSQKDTPAKAKKVTADSTDLADAPKATDSGDEQAGGDSSAKPKSENASAKAKHAQATDSAATADTGSTSEGHAATDNAAPEDALAAEGQPSRTDAVAASGHGSKAGRSDKPLAAPPTGQDGDRPEPARVPNPAGSVGVIAETRTDNPPDKSITPDGGGMAERLAAPERLVPASSSVVAVIHAGGDESAIARVSTYSFPSEEGEADPLPDRLAAGLLTGVVPLNLAALDEGMKQFLHQLDQLGEDLSHGLAGARLPSWLLAVGLAATACEVARRQVKPSPRRLMATGGAGADTRTWLPDPTSLLPRG